MDSSIPSFSTRVPSYAVRRPAQVSMPPASMPPGLGRAFADLAEALSLKLKFRVAIHPRLTDRSAYTDDRRIINLFPGPGHNDIADPIVALTINGDYMLGLLRNK